MQDKMPLKTLRKETSRHLYKLKFLEVPLDWLFLVCLIYYDRVNKSHRFVSFNCNHSHMKERKVSSYHFKLGKKYLITFTCNKNIFQNSAVFSFITSRP